MKRLRRFEWAILAIAQTACGGDLLVAENRTHDAGRVNPPTPVTTTAKPDAMAHPPPSTKDGGVTQLKFHNDPCDAAGIISFGGLAPFADPVVSATGYVVAFDPPAVLGSVPLTLSANGFGPTGEIAANALTGSPDCISLRSDAVFTILESSTGDVEPADLFALGIASGPNFFCIGGFGAYVSGADKVRVYGMLPGHSDLDGPLPLAESSPGHWTALAASTDLPRCGQSGYMVIVVAHSGAELIGLAILTQRVQ